MSDKIGLVADETENTMWRIQNSTHIVFLPVEWSKERVKEFRKNSEILKYGRIEKVLQLRPTWIVYGFIQRRDS